MSEDSERSARDVHERLIKLEARFAEFYRNIDSRIAALNNLRNEVMTDRSEFVRLNVYNERHESLERRLATIETWQARVIGAIALIVFVTGAIATLLEILNVR